MTRVPDIGTIRSAVSMAIRAPSIHNTQPWRWRIGDETIHLHANPSMALTEADPDGRELALSCGAALHHVRTAFAALGWQTRVTRLPNPADPLHIAAIGFSRHQPTEDEIELSGAISRRTTDRRHYSAWPVPPGRIARLTDAAAGEGASLSRIEVSDVLTRLLSEAANAHADDHAYRSELTMWSGIRVGLDGVPARNTPGVDASERVPARAFAHPALAEAPGSTEADGDQEVMILSTAADDHLDRIRAGEAGSAVLLSATALGLATCPITEPLEVVRTRESVRRQLLEGSGWPQMLIRVGWPPIGADPLPATPRRHLDEFLFDLEGAPLGHAMSRRS